MKEFASRAAGGSISVFSVFIRATTDRHQRSVINNVYYHNYTQQLHNRVTLSEGILSTVPLPSASRTSHCPRHACRTPSLSDLCFTGRQLSDWLLNLTIFPTIRPVTHGRHILWSYPLFRHSMLAIPSIPHPRHYKLIRPTAHSN